VKSNNDESKIYKEDRVMKKLTMTIFLILVLSVSATQVYALTAVDFTNPTIWSSGGTDVTGWEFTVKTDIVVNALGFYDQNINDPLKYDHKVGIFDATGTLLTPEGTTVKKDSTLDGSFRYASITNTLLGAGKTYIIAGMSYKDETGFIYSPFSTFTLAEDYITYNRNRHKIGVGNELLFPTTTNPTKGWFGVNFQFVATPEPSTLILLGLGLVGIGVWGKKKLS
jgi:hypothetical protein